MKKSLSFIITICFLYTQISYASSIVHVGIRFSFETAMSTVKRKDYKIIKELADVQLDYPNSDILISGHTDWIASDEINQVLSEARAISIKNLLIKFNNKEHFGKLDTKGFGKSAPVADNNTEDGRAKNRRFTASFYNLTNQEALDLVRKVEESRYLYIISTENIEVEKYISDIQEEIEESPKSFNNFNEEHLAIEEYKAPQSELNYLDSEKKERVASNGRSFLNGFYVGLSAGYVYGDVDVYDVAQIDLGSSASMFNKKFNIDGGLFGALIGYDYAFNKTVLGLELEYFNSGLSGSYNPGTSSDEVKVNVKSVALISAKWGFFLNQKLMLFGYLGYGQAKVEVGINHSGFEGLGDNLHDGMIVGAGARYYLYKNISVKIDMGFWDFAHNNYVIEDMSPFPLSSATAKASAKGLLIKSALNYHF